jgi:hypothetical protein
MQFLAREGSLEVSPEIVAFGLRCQGEVGDVTPRHFLQGINEESHSQTFLLESENYPRISSEITRTFGISTISGTGGQISSSLQISISKNFISVSPLLMVMSKCLGASLVKLPLII